MVKELLFCVEISNEHEKFVREKLLPIMCIELQTGHISNRLTSESPSVHINRLKYSFKLATLSV